MSELFTIDDLKQGVVCIYHNNCADGFTAAWIVEKYLSELEEQDIYVTRQYVGGVYGEKPEYDTCGDPVDMTDKTVFILDFSYSESELKTIAHVAHKLVILDHHKSAREAIESVIESDTYRNAVGIFDLDRSGAGITWDVFYPDLPRPPLVTHVEDRDLWKFENPCTQPFQQNLFSYEYTFSNWFDIFEETGSDDDSYIDFVAQGRGMMRKHSKDIDELLPQTVHDCVLDNTYGVAANLPYFYASEAGDKLSRDHAFAACYWVNNEGEAIVSLRSSAENENHVDVSEIAKVYGGGGHKHAAGFRMPVDEFMLIMGDQVGLGHMLYVADKFENMSTIATNTASRLFITNNLLLTAMSQLKIVASVLKDSERHGDIARVCKELVANINDSLDHAAETYIQKKEEQEKEVASRFHKEHYDIFKRYEQLRKEQE